MSIAEYLGVDYFGVLMLSIDQVQNLVNDGKVSLNPLQCQYLSGKLTKTRDLVRAKEEGLNAFRSIHDIRRVALLELLYVVKRAEKLVRHCCCETQLAWLEAAVPLAQISEDIADILLDLQWSTSMLNIAVASVARMSNGQHIEFERQIELELLRCAEEDYERLWKTLPLNNHLQEAARKDKDLLITKLVEVQTKYADRTESEQKDLDYMLAVFLLSRLNDVDQYKVPELNGYDDPKVIGQGSFGTVMKVKWLGRECALKILKVRCMKEATNLSKFHHPHIVQFLRYWEDPYQSEPGHPLQSHILMELMSRDLAQHMKALIKNNSAYRNKVGLLIRSEQPMPPFSKPVAIDLMLQVAKAMVHLDNSDIAHRDLKPGNVLVRPLENELDIPELSAQGYLRVKLADFGLAKAQARSSTYASQTANVGTKVYGAPEVFNKETINIETMRSKKFPHKADVWSFAIMLCEVLSGSQPFDGEPMGLLQGKIKKEGKRPQLPEGCPEYLKFCIRRCWELDPEDRPNFLDLLRMLRLAKVRSLGIIRNNHDLFAYTTRRGMTCLDSLGITPAPPKPPRPKTNVFCSLFSRSTFDLVRRWHPVSRSNPNRRRRIIQSAEGPGSLSQVDCKPLGYLVNRVWPLDHTADPPNSQLDVIFFEGNVGQRKALSCKDTWVQRGNPTILWPRDWLPKDLGGNVRVLLLEYSISAYGLEAVVDDLQRLLVFSDDWNRGHTWERPIVLVGHSLGCVIIQHLVMFLEQRARTIQDSQDEFEIARASVSKAFLSNMAGCFFYAPPHNGFVPSDKLLEHVFGGLSYRRDLFVDLCLDSSKPKKLLEDFMNVIAERVKLMAVTEGLNTGGRKVVPAAPMETFAGYRIQLADSNHSDVCKPTNKEHQAYQVLLVFVQQIMKHSKKIQHRQAIC